MAKSRTQIAREHVARLRRKAQAYDNLILSNGLLVTMAKHLPSEQMEAALCEAINEAREIAEKAVQE